MNNIKLFRQAKGWNQAELAKLMGVSRSTISMWEIGASQPDNDSLVLLANVLETSIDDLLCSTSPNAMLQKARQKKRIESLIEQVEDANGARAEEAELLRLWQNATKEGRQATLAVLRAHQKPTQTETSATSAG